MSDFGYPNRRTSAPVAANRLSVEGRWAMALGIVALLMGFGAAMAGAYVGFGGSNAPIALPGGLPPTAPNTLAIFLSACGTVTMLLGAITIYKAQDL